MTFDYATPLLSFDILLLSVSPIDDSDSGPNGGPAYTVFLSDGAGFDVTFNGGTVPPFDFWLFRRSLFVLGNPH